MMKPFHYKHLYPFLELYHQVWHCHRLWCPDMAICKSSTAGCEKPPCCHISHNSPLHYHNFAKHTIAVTQFHTSLCCSNTTLESTMHCHATTTIHTTPYHTKCNHTFVISNNILSHNSPLPYNKYAAGVTKLHTTPYQLSHNTHEPNFTRTVWLFLSI